MSTTATVTETRRAGAPASLSVLADYQVHHTGTEEAPAPNTATGTPQPDNWPSNHRRMPAYRPINHNLDFNDRAAGESAGEFIFIQGMLHGVWLNASVAQLWRSTGGKLNDKIFHYKIGGEW